MEFNPDYQKDGRGEAESPNFGVLAQVPEEAEGHMELSRQHVFSEMPSAEMESERQKTQE